MANDKHTAQSMPIETRDKLIVIKDYLVKRNEDAGGIGTVTIPDVIAMLAEQYIQKEILASQLKAKRI